MRLPRWPAVLLALAALGAAQDPPSTSPPASTTSSPSVSLSLTTGSMTIAVPTTIANTPTQVLTVVPAVFNVTYTLTPSATPTSNDTASASPTPEPIVLDTRVDPAFGVLGVILILTGLPSAFWGHKNRWTSFFLIGFYTLSLTCFVLILKFGILPAVNPPSKTLRGMFVLATTIAGFAGGAIAIFFWKAARYGIGFWGGFAFSLWIQSFNNGGIIKPIGFRWIFYIGSGVVGFALCTIPKIHYHILLISTAFVGATSFMLGVDCFTTAGMKEFYIWNLGFPSLFPKFVQNGIQFPVSQQMQIELGLTGAVALMGIAVQLRVLKVLQKKLREIAEEERKRDEEAEVEAAGRFDEIRREQEEWEKEHPTLSKHGRHESALSTTPLMKDRDGSSTPTTGDRLSSYTPHEEGRTRAISGLSELRAAPASEEELRRATRYMQGSSVLPTLDLGQGIQEDVPTSFISAELAHKTAAEIQDIKRKEELLTEIQNIRKSIDILKSDSLTPSDPSRRASLSSRRTLSVDANHALVPSSSHARPPRATDPRTRAQSMEFSALTAPLADPIARPTSTPLQDTNWDSYIQERKLLQPPAGVTAPIPTTTLASSSANRPPLAPAVQEALTQRKRRESAVLISSGSTHDSVGSSADDVPLAKIAGREHRTSPSNIPPQLLGRSSPSHQPQQNSVQILPPRRPSGLIVSPSPQPSPGVRVKTFEELNERHREKMRDIQSPLTKAEKESAELEAARKRWERSKTQEKEAMEKKQAEMAAYLEKEKKRRPSDNEGRKQRHPSDDMRRRHSRSMSGDRLAGMGGGHHDSSRRLSTLKVEDWQRYQQDTDPRASSSSPTGGMKRDSRSTPVNAVPFPADTRRKSRDYLN
ncbi:hypothetical protein EST38_g10525 [Candolleomyces aberdarensis]|uniref:TM7S3/TM198-like domain-containing protein n=1 Tax=Candolleomyces aberdarensis TaxID=2316362 RepID=A0A4Q2D9K7_9AGAR|nr:hypothetical protein EST38_g10525 [Candolleomyces aberdarensis]